MSMQTIAGEQDGELRLDCFRAYLHSVIYLDSCDCCNCFSHSHDRANSITDRFYTL